MQWLKGLLAVLVGGLIAALLLWAIAWVASPPQTLRDRIVERIEHELEVPEEVALALTIQLAH